MILATSYMSHGGVDRWERLWQDVVSSTGDPLVIARSAAVIMGVSTGKLYNAVAVADEIVGLARAVGWPTSLCYALMARGIARTAAEPTAGVSDLREALAVAEPSGNPHRRVADRGLPRAGRGSRR